MIGQQRALILGLLLFCCTGCRKDGDDTPPSVRIIAPAAGSTYSIPDTITVHVEASDDRTLEGLVIDVTDGNGISICTPVIVSENASSVSVARDLVIDRERTPSGTYTIVARASDGSNDGRAFLDIQLIEAPLRLRSIFLAPAFTTASATIQRVDSTGSVSDWLTLPDLNGIAVDGYSQHLMVAGSQLGPFQAIPTAAGSYPWQRQPPANDVPEQFTGLTVDPTDGRTYFATRDGFIRGFTGEGTERFTAEAMAGYRCEAIVVLDDRVATWQQAIVGQDRKVVTYSMAGTIQDILQVEHERVALFARTATSALLFANQDGSGLIEDLNIMAGGTPEVRSFAGEVIRAVVRLDANSFVIALADRLVRFNYPTNTIVELTSSTSADALAYDPATGALFAAEGNELLTIDPNSGTTTSTLSAGIQIGHILPLRNR
ncbi:MAG: hypothetical protein JNL43_11670 [Flavobacteriales bacterium]|nr:hypothetical protein [Flavobacteriales bacterium]